MWYHKTSMATVLSSPAEQWVTFAILLLQVLSCIFAIFVMHDYLRRLKSRSTFYSAINSSTVEVGLHRGKVLIILYMATILIVSIGFDILFLL